MKQVKQLGKFVMVASLAGLIGCTTINPYTEEQQTSKVAKGAGIGAVSGAVVGALVDGKKGAIKGAVAGAAVGGGVGYYMDVQEAKLRQKLRGTGVSVTRVGDSIVLNMPGNITFKTDSSEINAGFYEVLDSVNIVLVEYNETLIDVVGHTDSVGAASYNQTLSERRAQSVAGYFNSRGIDPQRLRVYGYGETQPIASNDTAEGRSQNRRVEITLTAMSPR